MDDSGRWILVRCDGDVASVMAAAKRVPEGEMTELERVRQEVDAAMKGQRTWAEGERPEGLRANLERLVREDERKKCAALAWQMQSKEGRSEIGNAITGRAEEKP